jgi:hypothetical protein
VTSRDEAPILLPGPGDTAEQPAAGGPIGSPADSRTRSSPVSRETVDQLLGPDLARSLPECVGLRLHPHGSPFTDPTPHGAVDLATPADFTAWHEALRFAQGDRSHERTRIVGETTVTSRWAFVTVGPWRLRLSVTIPGCACITDVAIDAAARRVLALRTSTDLMGQS